MQQHDITTRSALLGWSAGRRTPHGCAHSREVVGHIAMPALAIILACVLGACGSDSTGTGTAGTNGASGSSGSQAGTQAGTSTAGTGGTGAGTAGTAGVAGSGTAGSSAGTGMAGSAAGTGTSGSGAAGEAGQPGPAGTSGGAAGTGNDPKGACDNAADLAIIMMTSYDQAVDKCGRDCSVGGGTNCVRDCVVKATNVSNACAACYDGIVNCSRDNCWDVCILDSNSPDCNMCVDSMCKPAFQTCTGDG